MNDWITKRISNAVKILLLCLLSSCFIACFNNSEGDTLVVSEDTVEDEIEQTEYFDLNNLDVLNANYISANKLQFEFEDKHKEEVYSYIDGKRIDDEQYIVKDDLYIEIFFDNLPKEQLFSIVFKTNTNEVVSSIDNCYITEGFDVPLECEFLLLVGRQYSIEFNFENINLRGIYANCSDFDIKDIKEMNNLEYINIFDCHNSSCTDVDLLNFANLKVLKVLELEVNNELNYLTNLRKLYVYGLDGTKTNALNSLFKLELLRVSYVQMDNLDISNLVNLKHLKLGFNEDFDIDNIRNVAKLQTLYLSRANGELEALNEMYKLEELHILFFKGSGDIKELAKLINLRHLSITDSINIYGDLDDLYLLGNLEELVINNTNISRLGTLSSFSELKSLSITENQNLEGGLSVLKNTNRLETLYIYDTEGIEGDISVLSRLDDLREITICNQDGIFGDLSFVSGLSKIEKIYLQNMVNIEGEIEAISNHEVLKEVNISDCPKIDGNINNLYGLPSLEKIELNSVDIDGDIAVLASFTKLEDIWIFNNTEIYGDIVSLNSLKELKYIFLRQCPNLFDSSDESGGEVDINN